MIKCGDRVKDSITGLTGIVTTRCEWLHGCVRVTVQPEKLDKGKYPDSLTFDEGQLVIVRKSVHTGNFVPRSTTGGPRENEAKAFSRN